MGAHLIDGEFQSDKYPTCPPGKVPLSVKDKTAQDLLWEYAQRRRPVDAEFSDDLETVLKAKGFEPSAPTTDAALVALRRIDKQHLLDYATNFETQAEGKPEIKTRLALRLAALLRTLAAEQE